MRPGATPAARRLSAIVPGKVRCGEPTMAGRLHPDTPRPGSSGSRQHHPFDDAAALLDDARTLARTTLERRRVRTGLRRLPHHRTTVSGPANLGFRGSSASALVREHQQAAGTSLDSLDVVHAGTERYRLASRVRALPAGELVGTVLPRRKAVPTVIPRLPSAEHPTLLSNEIEQTHAFDLDCRADIWDLWAFEATARATRSVLRGVAKVRETPREDNVVSSRPGSHSCRC